MIRAESAANAARILAGLSPDSLQCAPQAGRIRALLTAATQESFGFGKHLCEQAADALKSVALGPLVFSGGAGDSGGASHRRPESGEEEAKADEAERSASGR